MPTLALLSWGKLKVCMYFNDHNPPHVHVLGPGGEARFNIETLELLSVRGFTMSDVTAIAAELEPLRPFLKEVWDDFENR